VGFTIFALFTERQVADRLGISISTVRRMRRTGAGPIHFHIGRLIRYRQEDVERFIADRLGDGEVAL
jgi:excisionase family DNA binding protein